MEEVLFFDIGSMGVVIGSNKHNSYAVYKTNLEKKLAARILISAPRVVSFNGKWKYRFNKLNYDYKELAKYLGEEPVFGGEHIDLMDELCLSDRFPAFFSNSLDDVYRKVFNLAESEMERITSRMNDGINDIVLDVFQTKSLWKAIESGLADKAHTHYVSLINE